MPEKASDSPPTTYETFESPPKPALFSINNVAMMIGVSKYVISKWEKRGLCKPIYRTASGARRYSHAQIQPLKELAAKYKEEVRERFVNPKSKKERGAPVWIERRIYDGLKEHVVQSGSNLSITQTINDILFKYLGRDKVTVHVTIDKDAYEGLLLEDNIEDLLNRLGRTIKGKKQQKASPAASAPTK